MENGRFVFMGLGKQMCRRGEWTWWEAEPTEPGSLRVIRVMSSFAQGGTLVPDAVEIDGVALKLPFFPAMAGRVIRVGVFWRHEDMEVTAGLYGEFCQPAVP